MVPRAPREAGGEDVAHQGSPSSATQTGGGDGRGARAPPREDDTLAGDEPELARRLNTLWGEAQRSDA